MCTVSQLPLAHSVRRNFAANWLSQFEFFWSAFVISDPICDGPANLGFQIEEPVTPPATITQLFIKWRNGDQAALVELASQV
jgi:hypothetical protein